MDCTCDDRGNGQYHLPDCRLHVSLDLYEAAMAADAEWSKLLRAQFGKQAGDVRYTKRGKGELGTPLRTAHDAFQAAITAWHNARR